MKSKFRLTRNPNRLPGQVMAVAISVLAMSRHPTQAQSLDFSRDLLRVTSSNAIDLAPVQYPQMFIGQAADPTPSPASNSIPSLQPEVSGGNFLDEVTVTATRRPTRQGDTTAVTYSIGKEDFARLGARTATDALLLVPGFQSAPSEGGRDNFRRTFFRGFDNTRFQVLRDGVLLQRPDDASSSLSRLTLEDIERIELVTGGATLRYGSGAVGGVVNLITEVPEGPPKLLLRYEAGSYGYSRYALKYGGGDNALSYNFTYTGLVAFNDYPFSLTVPNQAQFYGPNDFSPVTGPLYGLLRPDVGPPLTLTGRSDTGAVANDTFTGKLVFRPDPYNTITLRAGQINSKSPIGDGSYYFGVCRGGPNAPPNGTVVGSRFLPVDPLGKELDCSTQAYLFNTPTTVFASRYAYNASADGSVIFPSGQGYSVEPLTGTQAFNSSVLRTATEVVARWDSQISPTSSLNSYLSYVRTTLGIEVPRAAYPFNTNVLGTLPPGVSAALPLPPVDQPFNNTQRVEAQTALNWQISGGQNLQLGVNFTEDRVFQALERGSSFLDRSIARTSVFLVDDFNFSDQLKANVGFRYTYSTQYGSVGTPAIGLRYTPVPELSLRANYSYVYNSPTISALYVSGFPIVGNPQLRPETGQTYDIGVDVLPGPNLNFRLTYFSTYLDGVFGANQFLNPDPQSATLFPLLTQPVNLSSRYASGIELTSDWRITEQVRLQASWTNTDVRDYGPSDSLSQTTYPFYYQYQDPGVPFNRVAVALSYANKGLLVGLVAQYDGGKRRAAVETGLRGSSTYLPSWATLDLNVEIPITPYFVLTGNVFNITDTSYEYLPGVPAPGTTFRAGGRLEFGG